MRSLVKGGRWKGKTCPWPNPVLDDLLGSVFNQPRSRSSIVYVRKTAI